MLQGSIIFAFCFASFALTLDVLGRGGSVRELVVSISSFSAAFLTGYLLFAA